MTLGLLLWSSVSFSTNSQLRHATSAWRWDSGSSDHWFWDQVLLLSVVCTLPLEIHLSVSVCGDLIDPPTSARFFRCTSQVTSGKKPQAVTTWMCCGRNCGLYFYVVGPVQYHQSRLPQSLWTPGSWYRGWWARRSSQCFSRFSDVTIDMNTHHGEAKTVM